MLIFTADLHLSEKTPLCRTDDWLKTQARKLQWLEKLSCKYDAPVVCAGDLFHRFKVSHKFMGFCMDYLPRKFCTIAGNHDLPAHSMTLFEQSAMSVLEKADRIKVLRGHCCLVELFGDSSLPEVFADNFGEHQEPESYQRDAIYIGHQLLDTEDKQLKELKAHPFPVQVVGDYHVGALIQQHKKILLIPGSFMRIAADQIDYQPQVWLLDDHGQIEGFSVPIEPVVSREHLAVVQDAEARLDTFTESFISRLDSGTQITLDFRANLRKFIEENNLEKEVATTIWKIVEGNDEGNN